MKLEIARMGLSRIDSSFFSSVVARISVHTHTHARARARLDLVTRYEEGIKSDLFHRSIIG